MRVVYPCAFTRSSPEEPPATSMFASGREVDAMAACPATRRVAKARRCPPKPILRPGTESRRSVHIDQMSRAAVRNRSGAVQAPSASVPAGRRPATPCPLASRKFKILRMASGESSVGTCGMSSACPAETGWPERGEAARSRRIARRSGSGHTAARTTMPICGRERRAGVEPGTRRRCFVAKLSSAAAVRGAADSEIGTGGVRPRRERYGFVGGHGRPRAVAVDGEVIRSMRASPFGMADWIAHRGNRAGFAVQLA